MAGTRYDIQLLFPCEVDELDRVSRYAYGEVGVGGILGVVHDLHELLLVEHVDIQMVRALGMRMITEGVETEEQARFLLGKGCSDMQGYWFYRPMPVEEFEKTMPAG